MAISHTTFPESSLLSPLRTYQVRVSEPAGFLAAYGMNRVMVADNRIEIGGYKKLQSGGEFILDIILDGLQYAENRRITHTSTDKPAKTSYSQKIVFYVPVTVRILDANQQSITTMEIRNAKNVQEWNSNVYANSRDLDQTLNGGKGPITELVKKYLESAFADISNQLTKKYGFREEKDWVTFYELDSPHPKFTKYKKQTDLMEKELQSYKSGMNVNEARQRMQPALDYFTELILTLNKDDKQQKKLLKHTLINLFQLHFYLDDYDNFKKFGDIYSELEEDKEWKDSRLTIPDKMHKSIKVCGATSLYYVRDLTEIKPPVVVAPAKTDKEEMRMTITEVKPAAQEIDLSRLKLHTTDRVVNGIYIDKNHQSTKGYFVISIGDDELISFEGSVANTHFVYFDELGNPKTKALDPKMVDSFSIAQRQFITMDFKTPSSIGGKGISIMEVLAGNSSIKLYKYYPSFTSIGFDQEYSYVFIKPDETNISFTGKDIFWKKKARNFFVLCQAILDDIEKIKYVSPNKNITVDWVKKYDRCQH
jgi:hypothetical protein